MIGLSERERLPTGAASRARGLRARMNSTEQRLWKALRKLDANFRRQAPIGPYFADFASHGRRLVIEADGGIHQRLPEVAARDAARQAWLEGQGYRVLRFTDRQIHDDLRGVVEAVTEALLLDGGGLGGGGSAEFEGGTLFGSGARTREGWRRTAPTTIPDPSSIEEEGGVLPPAASGPSPREDRRER